MSTINAKLEKRRNELGFNIIGNAGGKAIYVSVERLNASQSEKRAAEVGLGLPAYQLVLSGFGADASLKGKFNDNGKTDASFWIAGTGKDTNHFVAEAQEPEITEAQEAEAVRLGASGMSTEEIARKLNVSAVGVYYALKKNLAKRKTRSKPRSSALCTFDKEGNLVIGKGDSLETTVRVSTGVEDFPLLFFILRDSYSRVGGARFVIAGCNGKQFTPDLLARVVVGIPLES